MATEENSPAVYGSLPVTLQDCESGSTGTNIIVTASQVEEDLTVSGYMESITGGEGDFLIISVPSKKRKDKPADSDYQFEKMPQAEQQPASEYKYNTIFQRSLTRWPSTICMLSTDTISKQIAYGILLKRKTGMTTREETWELAKRR